MWSPSQAAALRAAKRRPNAYPSIDLMPFFGVFFVLLVILMVNPTVPHRRRPLSVPEALNATLQPGALRDDAILVPITRDGRVFFRKVPVSPQQLPEMIRTALREGAEREVYLVVDRRTRYSDVEVVLDQVRLAGITNVVILAEKPQR